MDHIQGKPWMTTWRKEVPHSSSGGAKVLQQGQTLLVEQEEDKDVPERGRE
jgi:hypothetical protein